MFGPWGRGTAARSVHIWIRQWREPRTAAAKQSPRIYLLLPSIFLFYQPVIPQSLLVTEYSKQLIFTVLLLAQIT